MRRRPSMVALRQLMRTDFEYQEERRKNCRLKMFQLTLDERYCMLETRNQCHWSVFSFTLAPSGSSSISCRICPVVEKCSPAGTGLRLSTSYLPSANTGSVTYV